MPTQKQTVAAAIVVAALVAVAVVAWRHSAWMKAHCVCTTSLIPPAERFHAHHGGWGPQCGHEQCESWHIGTLPS